MGKRRRSNKSEEDIEAKIRKLQGKLRKKRQRRIISSSSDDNFESREETVNDIPPCIPTDVMPDVTSPLPLPTPPSPEVVATTSNHQTSFVDDEKTDEAPLEEGILKLLGDAPKVDVKYGKNIHKDIANRWQEILSKGLPKEIKEKNFCEYLIPANCDLLTAPALNPEAKAALADIFIKRDMALMDKQKHIGVALSALSQVMNLILSDNNLATTTLLKPLSDACRILCDSHYGETKLRRNFVISSVNSQLKDALVESNRDEFLFGTNLTEKLKSAKSIQQSGDALKQKFNRNNFISKTLNTPRNNLNARGLPREQRAPNRSDAGRARGVPRYGPPAQPRQPPPQPPRTRRPARAPPSPPPQRRPQRRY